MDTCILPPEILLDIAGLLNRKSTQKEFSLVCRWCHQITQPLLYRSIHLNLPKIDQAIDHFAEYPHLIDFVERVSLYSPGAAGGYFTAGGHWLHERGMGFMISFLAQFTSLTHVWLDVDGYCPTCDLSLLWTDDWLRSARSIRTSFPIPQLLNGSIRLPPKLHELSLPWIENPPEQPITLRLTTLQMARNQAARHIQIEESGLLQFYDEARGNLHQDFIDWLVKYAPKLEVLQLRLHANMPEHASKLLSLAPSFSHLRFFGIYNLPQEVSDISWGGLSKIVHQRAIKTFISNAASYFEALKSLPRLEGIAFEPTIGHQDLMVSDLDVSEPLLDAFIQVLDDERLSGSIPHLRFIDVTPKGFVYALPTHFELYKPGVGHYGSRLEFDENLYVYEPDAGGWKKNWVGFVQKHEMLIRRINGQIEDV